MPAMVVTGEGVVTASGTGEGANVLHSLPARPDSLTVLSTQI